MSHSNSTRVSRRELLRGVGVVAIGSTGCGDEADPGSTGNGGAGASGGASVGGAGGVASGGAAPGGAGGAGGGGPNPEATTWDARYEAALGPIPVDAKWVAMDGSDGNSGSEATPYATLAKALENIGPGGQVIVKDGVYTGSENWINDAITSIPSGTSNEKRTIIRAHHRFAVRLTQTTRPSGYTQSIIRIPPGTSFVWIDGIIAETSWNAGSGDDNASHTVSDEGSDNRLTRIIVKKSSCAQYGGAFAYGDRSVLEDCHAIGAGRYVFYGGAGGDSYAVGASVLRRCTSYLAFGPALEPTASFAFYGSNDGSFADCKDVLFANCYEIDSPHIEGTALYGYKWGSWYHAKSVRNVRHIGCGVLTGGAEHAAFRTDNYGPEAAALASYEDCFVWDYRRGSPMSVSAYGKATNGTITVDHCTAGALPGATYIEDPSTTTQANNLFGEGVQFLPMRVGNLGADQRYSVGRFLSRFGDEGFDLPQTDMPLWPFPYEAELAAVAAEPILRPTNHHPASVTQSSNPYEGRSLEGDPRFLTKRIWEAAGNPMPDLEEIYS